MAKQKKDKIGILRLAQLWLSDVKVTVSAAELNTLDGITANVAELNTLDGITANAGELNKLDGVTASTAEIETLKGGTAVTKLTETVAFGDFTDGGGAAGTYDITAGTIPIGATFLWSALTAVTGFAGDTSAALTIGDGTDADRYNTGTPDVFSDLTNGITVGAPSGVAYHDAAKTITLTVTTNADFTSVAAGSLTLDFFYLE